MKVFIIAAITADGFIGRDAGHTADWTGTEDKKVFVRLTKEAGTMVMGARTFDTIGQALPGRRSIVYTSRPEAYVDKGVETTSETPKNLLDQLENEGTKAVAICGGTSIYNAFMQAGVVDELYLTIIPTVFGTGVRLFSESLEVNLKLLEQTTLDGGAIHLRYAVSR